jgi:hypothetical protein
MTRMGNGTLDTNYCQPQKARKDTIIFCASLCLFVANRSLPSAFRPLPSDCATFTTALRTWRAQLFTLTMVDKLDIRHGIPRQQSPRKGSMMLISKLVKKP